MHVVVIAAVWYCIVWIFQNLPFSASIFVQFPAFFLLPPTLTNHSVVNILLGATVLLEIAGIARCWGMRVIFTRYAHSCPMCFCLHSHQKFMRFSHCSTTLPMLVFFRLRFWQSGWYNGISIVASVYLSLINNRHSFAISGSFFDFTPVKDFLLFWLIHNSLCTQGTYPLSVNMSCIISQLYFNFKNFFNFVFWNIFQFSERGANFLVSSKYYQTGYFFSFVSKTRRFKHIWWVSSIALLTITDVHITPFLASERFIQTGSCVFLAQSW